MNIIFIPSISIILWELNNLVVAQGDHVGSQQVHDLDGGYAPVFLIDEGAFEHISRDCVKHVLLLFSGYGDITGKHRDATSQLIVDLIGQEITMQVVGM